MRLSQCTNERRSNWTVIEEVNNCGGLVAPIHTTEVILR